MDTPACAAVFNWPSWRNPTFVIQYFLPGHRLFKGRENAGGFAARLANFCGGGALEKVANFNAKGVEFTKLIRHHQFPASLELRIN